MKKVILNIASVLLVNISFAQWINKTVDNGFDDPYRICYSKPNNGAILKLENVEGQISFYIQGTYFCSDSPIVDISFLVNNQWIKYSIMGIKNEQSDVLFLVDDFENNEMFVDFLKSNSVKLRVNEEYCDTDYFQFNMAGSTSAFKFLK
jgi:hypothetical protein